MLGAAEADPHNDWTVFTLQTRAVDGGEKTAGRGSRSQMTRSCFAQSQATEPVKINKVDAFSLNKYII